MSDEYLAVDNSAKITYPKCSYCDFEDSGNTLLITDDEERTVCAHCIIKFLDFCNELSQWDWDQGGSF
jgi:hypothetical protein